MIKPTAYDREVLYAFRSLFEGKANECQQKRAMEWLLFNLCHIGSSSFTTDAIEMGFLEGQRSVGLQIAKLREPEALALITPKRAKTEAKND